MAWKRKQTCMIQPCRWHEFPHFLVSRSSFWNQELHPSRSSFLKLSWIFSTKCWDSTSFWKKDSQTSVPSFTEQVTELIIFCFLFSRNQSKSPVQRISHLDFRDASFVVKSASSVSSMNLKSYNLPFFCP